MNIPHPHTIRKRLLLLTVLFCWTFVAQAEIQLVPIFSDGMVLQQKANVFLWGTAKPMSQVTVQSSWSQQTVSCQSDAAGKWQLHLPTPKASFQTYDLTFSDGQPLTIHRVLIGEVWLASGQSNMEMPLSGWANCPVEQSDLLIQQAQDLQGKVHYIQLPRASSNTPLNTLRANWKDCNSATAKDFSAVAYSFASILLEKLHCPIGIIHASYGGTRAEAWLPRDAVQNYPDLAPLLNNLEDYIPAARPTVAYNAMIHPLKGYTLRGFLWYQGEANVATYDRYASRLTDLIKTWRNLWQQGDLPFYMVEIAPYQYTGLGSNRAALLRDAQQLVCRKVPQTGIVCTNDLAQPQEVHQIHPSRKFEVGQRLAWLALSQTYGLKDLPTHYPQFLKAKRNKKKLLVTFSNAEDGWMPVDSIAGFELCGADNKYYPAHATPVGNDLEVSSPKVAHPVGLRYAYRDFLIGTVKNKQGLPLVPFQQTFH